MENKVYCKIEKPAKSKNNRIYGVIWLLGLLAQPVVYENINMALGKFDFAGIPVSFIAIAIQVCAFVGYIVRTYWTTTCEVPGPDTGPTDLWLDENGKPVQVVKAIKE